MRAQAENSTSKPAQPAPTPAPVVAPVLSAERPAAKRRESDISSISSYETSRDVFIGSDTEGEDSPPLPPVPLPAPASQSERTPNGHAHAVPDGHANTHEQDGSELSHSTASTVQTHGALQHQNQSQNQSQTGTGTEPPKRRKSVRMSLPPTFSTTPPAIAPESFFELEEGEPLRFDCVMSGLFSFARDCAADGSNVPSCHAVADHKGLADISIMTNKSNMMR